MKYFKLSISILLVFLFNNIFCQRDQGLFLFTAREYNKPFVSEINSSLNNLSFGFVESTKISGKDIKQLSVNEVHLGLDLPILYSTRNKFLWALSIPVSSHMVWYPLEKTTSPIINTDYRFGLSLSGHFKVVNPYIKNISFEFKPFAHESTHLGDEFTISGFQDDTSFYRVNVSYEYYELSFTLNDPEVLKENSLSLKMGFMGLLNPKKGYYVLSENEIGGNTLYPSKRRGEVYFDVNYRKMDGFLTSNFWKPLVSLELRNRIRYNYRSTEKEERVWCLNTYIGYYYTPAKINTVKSIGHYIRYYNGVNPNGQFRNGTCYFIGYSIIIKI